MARYRDKMNALRYCIAKINATRTRAASCHETWYYLIGAIVHEYTQMFKFLSQSIHAVLSELSNRTSHAGSAPNEMA